MTDAAIDLLVITPHGDVRDYAVQPNQAGCVTSRAVLEALYNQVDCTTIDVVRLAPEVGMWIDDDAALKPHLRINQLASYIATRFGLPFQLYVGVVVFTGGPDNAGGSTSLGTPARDTIMSLIAELRSIRWGQ